METKGGICHFCFFWHSDPLHFPFISQNFSDNISHLVNLFLPASYSAFLTISVNWVGCISKKNFSWWRNTLCQMIKKEWFMVWDHSLKGKLQSNFTSASTYIKWNCNLHTNLTVHSQNYVLIQVLFLQVSHWMFILGQWFSEWEQYFTFDLTRHRRAVQQFLACYFSCIDFIVAGIKSRANPKVSVSWQATSLLSLHFLGEEMGVLLHNFPLHPCGTKLHICTTFLWPVLEGKHTLSYVCQNTSMHFQAIKSREFGAMYSFSS